MKDTNVQTQVQQIPESINKMETDPERYHCETVKHQIQRVLKNNQKQKTDCLQSNRLTPNLLTATGARRH